MRSSSRARPLFIGEHRPHKPASSRSFVPSPTLEMEVSLDASACDRAPVSLPRGDEPGRVRMPTALFCSHQAVVMSHRRMDRPVRLVQRRAGRSGPRCPALARHGWERADAAAMRHCAAALAGMALFLHQTQYCSPSPACGGEPGHSRQCGLTVGWYLLLFIYFLLCVYLFIVTRFCTTPAWLDVDLAGK